MGYKQRTYSQQEFLLLFCVVFLSLCSSGALSATGDDSEAGKRRSLRELRSAFASASSESLLPATDDSPKMQKKMIRDELGSLDLLVRTLDQYQVRSDPSSPLLGRSSPRGTKSTPSSRKGSPRLGLTISSPLATGVLDEDNSAPSSDEKSRKRKTPSQSNVSGVRFLSPASVKREDAEFFKIFTDECAKAAGSSSMKTRGKTKKGPKTQQRSGMFSKIRFTKRK